MAMDPSSELRFETVVLDDQAGPWDKSDAERMLAALDDADFTIDEMDGTALLATIDSEDTVPVTGSQGRHGLRLEPGGAWRWDTPFDTMMRSRHTNKPEGVKQMVAGIAALLPVGTPYFGCTWEHIWPPWIHTDEPFFAMEGAAVMFFSSRYIDTQLGGSAPSHLPGRSDEVADGRLVVGELEVFGEDNDGGLLPLHQALAELHG